MGNFCGHGRLKESENKVINIQEINETKIKIVLGDITREKVDVIVNPANTNLQHTTGVSQMICQQAGISVQSESNQLIKDHGSILVGNIAVTGAGRLQCKQLIHAVGPIYSGGSNHEHRQLADLVRKILMKTEELKFSSISIPAISSGLFAFPANETANVLLEGIKAFLVMNPLTHIKEIRLTNNDFKIVRAFQHEIEETACPSADDVFRHVQASNLILK